jgi:hypothetical protein
LAHLACSAWGLWALEDVRRITGRVVAGVDAVTLDWRGPDGTENSIGSLLYHVALVEMDWLFCDVLGEAFPDEVAAELPFEMRSGGGLTHVGNVSLEDHLARLERMRGVFLARRQGMTLDDFRRVRAPDGEDYEVTAEWTVYHLVEHEAGHAYQMRSLKRRAGAHLGGGAPRCRPSSSTIQPPT